MRMSVNLSAKQFNEPNLVKVVAEIIEETGIPPEQLELEITESVIMTNVNKAIETLKALNAMGIKLSIDDFGTGYSSLSYLKRFPLNTLKIDRSFINDVTEDPDDAAIVEMIINMARTLKLKVVAEGVETDSQADFLRQTNCDLMQGFLFCRPVPVPEIDAIIANNRN